MLLALILIVAAAVRLIGIGQQSLSIDEIHELRIAHAGIADIATFGDGFPPLYNLLVHLFLPFGDLAGRVLSAVFGVAAVGVAWAWGRWLAGCKVGLCASLCVALSPVAVQLSGEGRAYALMALLAAVSMWLLWVALDDPSTPRWLRWGLVSALGIYTHYLFAVLVIAWFVVALIEVRLRPPRGMWVGIGTLVALAAPVLAFLPGDSAVQMHMGLDGGLRPVDVMYAGYRLIAGFFLGPAARDVRSAGIIYGLKAAWPWIAVLAPVIGLLLLQGYRALDRVARRRLLTLSALGLLLESAAIEVSGVGFGVRYLLWLSVPLALWLAVGLAHVQPRWRWVLASVLLSVSVLSLVTHHLDPHRHVEDVRGVAAYLESSGGLDHPVLVLGQEMVRPVMYYIDRTLALALPDEWDAEAGRLSGCPDEQLAVACIPKLGSGVSDLGDALTTADARTQPGEPYYLVYSHPSLYDRHGELLAVLSARDGLVLVERFAGVDVYRGVRSE